MAQDYIIVQEAKAALDEVRARTNPLMGTLYGRLIRTLMPSLLIFAAVVLLVSTAQGYVYTATTHPLVLGVVNFVGLVLGFLAAHALFRLMERRLQGVALFKTFLDVAQHMRQVRALVKVYGEAGSVPPQELDNRVAAMLQRCDAYIATMAAAGVGVEQ